MRPMNRSMRLLNKALDAFIKERGMMHIPDMVNQAPRIKMNPYKSLTNKQTNK